LAGLTLLTLARLLPRLLRTLAALAGLALAGLPLLGTLRALALAGLALTRLALARLALLGALVALAALALPAFVLLHSLALFTRLVLLLAGLTLLTRTLIAVISHGNFLALGDWLAPARKPVSKQFVPGSPFKACSNPPAQSEPSVT